MAIDNLQKKLAPEHLIDLPDDDSELKNEIENAVEPEKQAVESRLDDPRNNEEYTFTLRHRDARNRLWEGTFTTKILTIGERQLVGVMRSRYQGGVPLEALDASTADLNLQLAYLSYSLVNYPKWAAKLRELKDPGVINAIYQEVASHEAFFLGWDVAQG
jgi:hypothetical protein